VTPQESRAECGRDLTPVLPAGKRHSGSESLGGRYGTGLRVTAVRDGLRALIPKVRGTAGKRETLLRLPRRAAWKNPHLPYQYPSQDQWILLVAKSLGGT